MKEYSPKSDLWRKIQQQKNFDSQLKTHTTNLPERVPNKDIWSAIESELDHTTPVIPIWKYGLAAASIVLVLLISGVAYLQFAEKDSAPKLTTEVIGESPDAIVTEQTPQIQKEAVEEEAVHSEVKRRTTNVPTQKDAFKTTHLPILTPMLDLPDLNFENLQVAEIIIPPLPEPIAPATLHNVQISWGLQEDKNKLRTTFGASDPENITNQQIGRADQTPRSIKIKLKRQ